MSPYEELRTSRLRVYRHGKVVKDQTTCHCGLIHKSPMTHELHELLVNEVNKALHCESCVHGQYDPHLGVAGKFQTLIAQHDAALKQRRETTVKLEARLVELDLLEQFINNNEYKERFVTVLKQFKLERLKDLTERLEAIQSIFEYNSINNQ